MKLTEHLATVLRGNLGFVEMHLADLSDADLLVRPVLNANHGNWQLGHVINAEFNMLTMAGAKLSPLPAGFGEIYNKEAAKIDDAAKFLTKEQLLSHFKKLRGEVTAYVETMSDEQLDVPAPERMRKMAPKFCDLLALLPVHVAMHIGQIQVIRRKLGKPILF